MSKAEDKEVETIFENLKNSGCLAFVNDGADADTLGVWLQAVAPAPIRIEEGNGRNVNNHRYYPRWIVDPIMHNDEDLTGVSYIRYRKEDKREYLFVNFGEKETEYSLPILFKAREAGIRAEIYPDSAKMKKQMSYANAKQIPFVAIVGENEMNEGKVTLKNMTTGEQSLLTPEELVAAIK